MCEDSYKAQRQISRNNPLCLLHSSDLRSLSAYTVTYALQATLFLRVYPRFCGACWSKRHLNLSVRSRESGELNMESISVGMFRSYIICNDLRPQITTAIKRCQIILQRPTQSLQFFEEADLNIPRPLD